ncbi:MAG: hypothetical protein ACJ8DI_24840 [Ktedonobacteraceae bacterium]
MRDEDTVVRGVAISRKNLIELIVIAILLSFGINLIAGQILSWLNEKSFIVLLIGFFLCLVSIVYTLFSLFGSRTKSHTYEGFLIDGPAKNNITSVPGYELSEEVHDYLQGAFAENAELLTLWQERSGEKDRLLTEAIEYFILRILSFHLEEYFNDKAFKKENLTTYGRMDIPSVLLSNTFLELFSRSMTQRPAFVGMSDPDDAVFAWGDNGAFFDKFDLILPKGSVVKRPAKNKIAIETRKLKILMAVRYDGHATMLPRNFEEYYLHLPHDVEYTNEGTRFLYSLLEIHVDIQITVKSQAMLSSSGWEYYRWVDSFLERIEKEISREAFFNRIQWESVVSLLECLKRSPHLPQQHSQKDTNNLAVKTVQKDMEPSKSNLDTTQN